MNIEQMRYFAAVAQLENMSRASELLHISQSSLSKNISKLEAEIGTPLFLRSGKKIELNAAGVSFLSCCNQVLRCLDTSLKEIRLTSGGGDQRIRIGTAGICAPVVRCMTEFSRKNPGTEFDINCSIEGVEHIDINAYDVLVYPDEPKYEKFNGYHLCREKYYLAVAADHPLASSAGITLRKLDGLDMVFLRIGENCLETPFELCTALALHFGSQCFADSRELHRQMVSSCIAAGFVPEGEAEIYRSDSRIHLLPILDQRFTRNMMVCFKRDKHLTARARSFKDFIMTQLHLEQ